jgi:hypothetical protein
MKLALDVHGNLADCTETTAGDFRCINCGVILINRNELKVADGRIRDYYFAHPTDSSCTGSPESYIHRVAKLIIEQHESIKLPEGHGVRAYTTCEVECRDRWIDYWPDVLIEDDLLIEVLYRNPKKAREKKILSRINLDAIEIDLSKLTEKTDYETFVHAVINDDTNRQYLHRHTAPIASIPWTWEEKLLTAGGLILAILGIRALCRWIKNR